ncbi:IstB domain-containing ATP-binding protein [Cupriavidus sp. HMR-1]|nr:IstB domain-containing ATP-binding protein [Cupriavidus sp. HMR-1]
MTMSLAEIDRALRELRLSGIGATLETRVLQAQASQQPFLETFSMILQDELDRRRSRLLERRYQQSGLEERRTLAEFDWAFNPKLPRQACFELHTLKFVADADNALLIGGMRISRLKWLKLRLLRSTAPVLICPRRRSSALVLIRPSRAGP